MTRDYLSQSAVEFSVRGRIMPGFVRKSATEITLADVERAEDDLEDYVIRQRRKLANIRATVEKSDAVAEQLGRVCEVDEIIRKAVSG